MDKILEFFEKYLSEFDYKAIIETIKEFLEGIGISF